MKDTLLKEKPLFQSTLGDLVEVLQARVVTMKRTTSSHLVVNIMSGA